MLVNGEQPSLNILVLHRVEVLPRGFGPFSCPPLSKLSPTIPYKGEDDTPEIQNPPHQENIMPGNNFLRHVGLVSPTLDTNAVADGDIIFDTTAIPNYSLGPDQPAYLVKLIVYAQDDLAAADLRLIFIANSTSLGTLNSAPNISDANGLDIVGDLLIASADWHDLGEFKWVEIDLSKLPQAMHPKSGTSTLYFAGLATGAQTYTESGLKFRFFVQDMLPF